VLGVGLDYTWRKKFPVFANYEVQLWGKGDVEQTINAGVRLRF
jgi:outer membrane autotransporter protein